MGIKELYTQYLNGKEGRGAVLLHNHKHDSPLCESLCILGAQNRCPNPVNCPSCYDGNGKLYCLEENEEIPWLLVHEEKHRKLVERGAPGAYHSVQEALDANS
jgi:hypothetical protein